MAFIVIDPNLLIDNFAIQLDEDNAQFFGTSDIDDQFALMAIVNVPQDDPIAMTANLRAPIIVHLDRKVGRQVILADEDLPIRHPIFADSPGGGN